MMLEKRNHKTFSTQQKSNQSIGKTESTTTPTSTGASRKKKNPTKIIDEDSSSNNEQSASSSSEPEEEISVLQKNVTEKRNKRISIISSEIEQLLEKPNLQLNELINLSKKNWSWSTEFIKGVPITPQYLLAQICKHAKYEIWKEVSIGFLVVLAVGVSIVQVAIFILLLLFFIISYIIVFGVFSFIFSFVLTFLYLVDIGVISTNIHINNQRSHQIYECFMKILMEGGEYPLPSEDGKPDCPP